MRDQITEAAWIAPDGTERQYFVTHDRLPNPWVMKPGGDYLTRIFPGRPKKDWFSVFAILNTDCLTESSNGSTFMAEEPTYLVGANPAFDDAFIRQATFRADLPDNMPYHYHLIDIEAVVQGVCGLAVPPRLKECRGLLGISGENPAAHTALSDAREVKLIHKHLMAQFNRPISTWEFVK